MPKELYEGIAVSMTYVFLVLMLLVCVCSVRVLLGRRRELGEAEARPYVGQLLVSGGGTANGAYYIGEDVTLGRSSSCDIQVRHKDMPAQAARIIIEDGKLCFYPSRAVEIQGESYTEPIYLDNGTVLRYGALKITLRLPSAFGGRYEAE